VAVAGWRPVLVQRANPVTAIPPHDFPSTPTGGEFRTTRARHSGPMSAPPSTPALAPTTPATEHREVSSATAGPTCWIPVTPLHSPRLPYRSIMPVGSPRVQKRTVPSQQSPLRTIVSSPQVQYRTIDPWVLERQPRHTSATSTLWQTQQSMNNSSRSNGRSQPPAVGRPVHRQPQVQVQPCSTTMLPRYVATGVQSPVALSPLCHTSRVPRSAPMHSRTLGMTTSQQISMDDIGIQNTVAMLPPSPVNSLPEFLANVVSGDVLPAMCHREPRADPARYWEKRRVQNSLRRLLESLQERFGIDGDEQGNDLGGAAYDELLRLAPGAGVCIGDPSDLTTGQIDEEGFTRALDVLGAWPPEMSPADRSEVFAALRAPSSAAVRALSTGQPLPARLSRRMLCEGLTRVPFNVPDFPVPTHLIRAVGRVETKVFEVAQAISFAFCMEQTGLERVKDFFLCGLLSIEEIQVALPQLYAETLVEEAVMKIIRTGAERFTPREWQTLVLQVRMIPAEGSCDEMVLPATPSQSPAQSPSQRERHRDVQQPVSNALDATYQNVSGAAGATADASSLSRTVLATEEVHGQAPRGLRQQPPAATAGGVTEPLPDHVVRHVEEPLRLPGGQPGQAAAAGQRPVINWSTTSLTVRGANDSGVTDAGLCYDLEHQADEGAGTRVNLEQEFFPAQAAAAGSYLPDEAGSVSTISRSTRRMDDPVRLISVDMHNECLGPLLALAFTRCCQLYEAGQAARERGYSVSGEQRHAAQIPGVAR